MPREVGSLSKVPYAEPTWLSDGFHSPYYKQVNLLFGCFFLRALNDLRAAEQSHRDLQKAMRKFVDDYVYPDAQVCALARRFA